jgi:hypothetical protein
VQTRTREKLNEKSCEGMVFNFVQFYIFLWRIFQLSFLASTVVQYLIILQESFRIFCSDFSKFQNLSLQFCKTYSHIQQAMTFSNFSSSATSYRQKLLIGKKDYVTVVDLSATWRQSFALNKS